MPRRVLTPLGQLLPLCGIESFPSASPRPAPTRAGRCLRLLPVLPCGSLPVPGGGCSDGSRLLLLLLPLPPPRAGACACPADGERAAPRSRSRNRSVRHRRPSAVCRTSLAVGVRAPHPPGGSHLLGAAPRSSLPVKQTWGVKTFLSGTKKLKLCLHMCQGGTCTSTGGGHGLHQGGTAEGCSMGKLNTHRGQTCRAGFVN